VVPAIRRTRHALPVRLAKISACLHSQSPVAAAVNENLALDSEQVFRAVSQSDDSGDAVFACHLHADATCVEQQSYIGFAPNPFVEKQVPHAGAPLWVADGAFQTQLFQDARFACVSVFATSRAIGADDVHANFAGRISAQNGAVLNQHDGRTIAGCCDGSTNACHPTSHHDDISFQFLAGEETTWKR